MSRRLIGLAAAATLASAAIAQVPPPPPPPPPASATPPVGGLVTKIGIDGLKKIFEEAGVAYTVESYEDGYPYLAASPEGYRMFVTLLDCAEKTKALDCSAIAMESGAWVRKLTLDQVNMYNRGYGIAKAALHNPADGQPVISATFGIYDGVSPTYIRGQLKLFLNNMKIFGSFKWLPDEPADAAAGGTGGSFAMSSEKPTLAGRDLQRTDSVPTGR